ncbi:glycosyltransferase family protein [Klebsormidium nitens]|uniref:Glycosyltransferase family protein n=1 Tax=Klebsormidium nitens TaxID=105231 RepID=A0A1Y1HMH7_KLENI|nr:glycosyltransferase family protein [Klebsormidium nitens]|eukprot:GAQ78902.1 glycosyltransferase family protein [Klebsormidium nitens]
MLLTGDWITPQFNAQPRFDKPALIYWLAAAGARVLGRNRAWAYRLPSTVCASLLMWGLVKVVRQFGLPFASEHALTGGPISRKKGSLVSCIVVACAFALSTEVVVWGSIGVSDMLLTSTTGACLLAFFYGYAGQHQRGFRWGYPLSAIFMALSVLSKGPVGVVVPTLVCATFLMYTGELLTVLQELPLLKGASIVLGLNAPWYLTMVQRHGRMYWATFFGYHNLERFTKGVNHHDGMPFWFPSAVVLAAHLPWSLAVPVALLRSRLHSHRSLWLATSREDRLVPFAASWFLAVFAFFSSSASQLPSYYLPLSPAVALLAASLLTWQERREDKPEAEEQEGVPPNVARLTAASTLAAYALQAVALSQLPAMLASSADAKAIEIGIRIAAQHLHWTGTAIFGAGALAVTRTHEFSAVTKPLHSEAHQSPSSGPIKRKLRLPLLRLASSPLCCWVMLRTWTAPSWTRRTLQALAGTSSSGCLSRSRGLGCPEEGGRSGASVGNTPGLTVMISSICRAYNEEAPSMCIVSR